MPKPPDDSERAAAGTLPDDPEADTEPMPAPGLPPRLGELLPSAITRLRRRHSGEERPVPLPWPTMAEPLGGGLEQQTLNILVGSTGAGKTQFLLQVAIAAAMAQSPVPVLYVALEASEVEFVTRCLSFVSGAHWSPLYHGRYTNLDPLLDRHVPTLQALPLHLRLAPPHGWPATALVDDVQRLRDTYPERTPGDRPLLVVIDFLQLVAAEKGQREELRERIGRAAYVARGVAREYNAAVILASSAAREHYLTLTGRKRGKGGAVETASEKLGKGDASRFIGLGKESGDIEYAADNLIVLTQEPWENDTKPQGGTICHFALAKIRAGEPTWVPPLCFDGRAFTKPKADEPGSILV